MLNKSISLVSLPLSRRLSLPFWCIRRHHHHHHPCRPTISQDAQSAWTRRAQPVADPDRRASLRKFSHALNPQSASTQCHSHRAAVCIVKLSPKKNPGPPCTTCGSSSAAMRVGYRYIVDATRDKSRTERRDATLRGWPWACRLTELSWWNFNPDDAAIACLTNLHTANGHKNVRTLSRKGRTSRPRVKEDCVVDEGCAISDRPWLAVIDNDRWGISSQETNAGYIADRCWIRLEKGECFLFLWKSDLISFNRNCTWDKQKIAMLRNL